ncbi:hypothetical protein [Chromobacterium haemolyticum]|nr:hypothetical protein [Chromobacterium haemolyticum]
MMDKEALRQEAMRCRNWFSKGQRLWSFAHHTAIFGSILCSVVVGGLLQVQGHDLKGYSTVLTSIAAALSSLAAAGGFERKWKSNRLSRSRVDGLLIDIEAGSYSMSELACQLKEIISKHDLDVTKRDSMEPLLVEHKTSSTVKSLLS